MKAEVAEAPTSSKKEQTKSSQSEKKVEKVLSTAELLPASKELMAEVEAWDHEDNAEADIFAMAEVDCLANKLASAACCDKDKSVQEKKEQYKEVPLMTEKQDQVGVSLSMQGAELKQCSHPYLIQVKVPGSLWQKGKS